ncbi:hypothetical protein BT93_L5494 [Corymbia citriodora subsp. variegata]|uniref:Uncharacterized protein n=1 Tax=Corymbia citriodora subsp. variegata TaxID=360336 RepID=A0A8T0CS77_CORYI|nr:hypothetical protein BT93_L5494 [Corymbia citriodora subsp. variegata]
MQSSELRKLSGVDRGPTSNTSANSCSNSSSRAPYGSGCPRRHKQLPLGCAVLLSCHLCRFRTPHYAVHDPQSSLLCRVMLRCSPPLLMPHAVKEPVAILVQLCSVQILKEKILKLDVLSKFGSNAIGSGSQSAP